MEGLYRAATLLAFPSLAEGFGLPVLEAMRRGLPVACSDTTSLPEVAGDAALTFDPLDEGAIRDAVARLLGDAGAARGPRRAAAASGPRGSPGRPPPRHLGGLRPRPGRARAATRPRRRAAARSAATRASSRPPRSRCAPRTVRQAPAFVAARAARRRPARDLPTCAARPCEIVVRHGAGDAPTRRRGVPRAPLRAAAAEPALDPAAILDLGANIGLFGAFAAARWPRARIVAYEPDPANAEVCRACIDANGLGARWELTAAPPPPTAPASCASMPPATRSRTPTRTASSSSKRRDVLPEIAGADLVKMDIEGGEWAILRDPRFAAAAAARDRARVPPAPVPVPDPRAAVERAAARRRARPSTRRSSTAPTATGCSGPGGREASPTSSTRAPPAAS